MKRILVTLLLAAVSTSVFAQGKIGWGNSGTTRVNDGAGTFTGQIGFYMSTDSGTTFNLVASSVKPVSSGLFLGAPTSLTLVDGSSNPITGAIQYQVKAWSTGFASYEAALAGADGTTTKGGISAVGTIDPTNLSTDPTPSLVINGGFAGFSVALLNPVPEPSTYALMALGLGGLLFIRRRK